MAFKKEDKWYISSKIKKDDGTYYSYKQAVCCISTGRSND